MIPISIICPVYNEKDYIAACIDSILTCDYPKEYLEFIIVDGMSNDGTREIIRRYQQQHAFIQCIDNPAKVVSPALNRGIKIAKGEYIFRIDAHAEYPQNYFTMLLKYIIELQADNVGAVCHTVPADNSAKANAIATALASPFGMGNSYFRIGCDTIRQVDTVPFGCFHKSLFEKIGYFDEELIRNQDDEFNGRIVKNGGKIFLIPSLVVTYVGRNQFDKTSKMFYQYGLFKPLVNKKLGAPATLRQFVPPLFVATTILLFIFSLFFQKALLIFLFFLAFYFLVNLLFSMIAGIKKRKITTIPYLLITFAIIHFSYGVGYWVGIFRIIGKRQLVAQTNR